MIGLCAFSICSAGIGHNVVVVVVVDVGICVVCVSQHGIDHHLHRFVVDRQQFSRKLQGFPLGVVLGLANGHPVK